MEFLFGLFTFWFVLACLLFMKDAKQSDLRRSKLDYFFWPFQLYREWRVGYDKYNMPEKF